MLIANLHIAFTLGLLALTGGIFLVHWLMPQTGVKLAMTVGCLIIVLAILNLACTAYYAAKYWRDGYFATPCPMMTYGKMMRGSIMMQGSMMQRKMQQDKMLQSNMPGQDGMPGLNMHNGMDQGSINDGNNQPMNTSPMLKDDGKDNSTSPGKGQKSSEEDTKAKLYRG